MSGKFRKVFMPYLGANLRTVFFQSALILALIMSLISVSYATNGYLLHGYGKNKGMGGAGIANPQDALAGATNPAGAVWVGDRFDVTGELFAPSRGYDIYNPTPGVPCGLTAGPVQTGIITAGQGFDCIGQAHDLKSEKDFFMIPAMGFVKQLPHGNAVGLSIYGAGLGTEFNARETPNNLGTFLDGSAGVDLLLIMSNLHFATKVTDNISIGVGIVGAAQSFKAKGLSLFSGVSQGDIDNNKRDWTIGAGYNFGFQANLTDQFSIAGSYYSKIKLTHDRHYTGLFAGSGDFSLAPITNFGMTYKPNRTSALSFDIQYIAWSDVPSAGNKLIRFVNPTFNFASPLSPTNFPLDLLGSSEGAGFGFNDSLVYKMGYQFKAEALPKFTWRVGYSYQDQIIDRDGTLFPILAPATIQHHYTAGFTHDFSKDIEINMNFLYTGKEEVKGNDIAGGIDIYLEEYGLELGLGYKF